MTGPGGRSVGRVSIRVLPDTSKFASSLKKYLDRIEKTTQLSIDLNLGADAKFRADVEKVRAEVTEGGITFFTDLDADKAKLAAAKFRAEQSHNAISIPVNLDTSQLKQAASLVSKIGLSSIKVVGIAAVLTQVAGLASALSQAAGIAPLIPAALLGGGAIIGAITIGLKGATAQAHQFSTQLSSAMASIQGQVGTALFANLNKSLSAAIKNLLPTFKAGLTSVATGVNAIGIAALSTLAKNYNAQLIGNVLANTAAALKNLSKAVQPVLDSFIAIAETASGFFPQITASLGGMAQKFSDFIQGVESDGSLETWIQNALTLFGNLSQIVGHVGGIFGSIFAAAGGTGAALIQNLAAVTGKVADFLNTSQGVSVVSGFFDQMSSALASFQPALGPLGAVVSSVAGQIGPLAQAILPALAAAFQVLGPAVTSVVQTLGPVLSSFLATALPAIASALASLAPGINAIITALGSALSSLGPALTVLGTALGQGLVALAPAFAPLAGVIVAVVNALTPLLPVIGQLIGQLIPPLASLITTLVIAIAPLVSSLATGLQPLFPIIAQAVTTLVTAFGPLITQLVTALTPVLPVLVESFKSMITNFTAALPALAGLISGFLPLLPTISQLLLLAVQLAPIFVPFLLALQPVAAIMQIITPLIALFSKALNFLLLPLVKLTTVVDTFVNSLTTIKGLQAVFRELQTAFSASVGAIATAANATFNNVLLPAFNGLKVAVAALGTAAIFLWQNALIPAFKGIMIFLTPAILLLKIGFYAIELVVALLALAVIALWKYAFVPAFEAISTSISSFYTFFLQPTMALVVQALQFVGDAALFLWQNAIVPAFNGIAAVVTAVYNTAIAPVLAVFAAGFSIVANAASALWHNSIEPVFAGISQTISTTVGAISGIFDSARALIDGSWSAIWDGLSSVAVSAFDGIETAIKGAINGVIGAIDEAIGFINSKLIDTANQVPFVNIPHIPSIPKLAAGADILPTAGGTLAILGEGGQKESVVNTGGMNKLIDNINKNFTGTGAAHTHYWTVNAAPGQDVASLQKDLDRRFAWAITT